MSFRITGLDPAHFSSFYGLSDAELAARGARRCVVSEYPGFPDRIELRDLEPGETALLVNYAHQPAATAFRASHAVFVREGAQVRYDAVDAVPEVLRRRMLSLRAFDADHWMVAADLVDGHELEPALAQLLSSPTVSYVHAHYAKPGCYAARIDRA